MVPNITKPVLDPDGRRGWITEVRTDLLNGENLYTVQYDRKYPTKRFPEKFPWLFVDGGIFTLRELRPAD